VSPPTEDLLGALANVEIIIQEWIETAKELGRPIPPRAA
jgi:predicted RNase H-like HicB family nuclease